jgi:hypothetical protein
MPQEVYRAAIMEIQRALPRRAGVVSVRPEDHLYAVLVDEQVTSRIEGGADVVGSFSNPKIETFGPPRRR